MARYVILEHEVAPGVRHYDWMIERVDAGCDPARPLLTFRVPVLPTEADDFRAERIADHRARYLDYEGPISGGRGTVRRLVQGEAEVAWHAATGLRVTLGPGRRVLAGVSDDGRWWWFTAVPI